MLPHKFGEHPSSLPTDPIERRELIERERLRLVAERQQLIDSQTAPEYGAPQRIRLWERLHQLHLPTDPNHALIRVIAKQTALSVAQIHQEQTNRASLRNPPSPEPPR